MQGHHSNHLTFLLNSSHHADSPIEQQEHGPPSLPVEPTHSSNTSPMAAASFHDVVQAATAGHVGRLSEVGERCACIYANGAVRGISLP